MKISLNWLKSWVPFELSAQELADLLSVSGHEVEGITYRGEKLHQIITGKIESIEKHPNADKLVITQIFDGQSRHQIVTGATNISVGDIVPVSLPGSVLANGMVLKASPLRGVDSFGMLCSQKELGVAEEAQGIWILDPSTPIGVDLIAYAGLQDAILEISILPNRGDCMSALGIARDISAILNLPLTVPAQSFEVSDVDALPVVSVQDTDFCPYYSGYVLRNLRQGETPMWMQQRLAAGGMRPVSLFVDITNYVLLEMGQPLHAFDLGRLRGRSVCVRAATEGETVVGLDQQRRSLSVQDAVIAAGSDVVAIAGVMGDLSTGVTETTTEIFLEAAFFDPARVRRTANRLGLRTESAIRFEKTVDPQGVQRAAHRALHLFQTLAGAEISKQTCVVKADHSPLFTPKTLPFQPDQLNALLGTALTREAMTTTLSLLGFSVKDAVVEVPSYRAHDIAEWPCLAEEIIRIQGFDAAQTTLPQGGPVQDSELPLVTLSKKSRTFWVDQGFHEAMTFPMVSPEVEQTFSVAPALTIMNPISSQESVMRSSMAGALFQSLMHNIHHQNMNLRLFEIGKVFHHLNREIEESTYCAGMVTGDVWPGAYQGAFKATNTFSFGHIKGLVSQFCHRFSLVLTENTENLPDYMHPNKSLSLYAGKERIGCYGQLHPRVCQDKRLKTEVFYFEFNLSVMSTLKIQPKRFKPFSKFPSVTRDLAFLSPQTLSYQDIVAVIQKFKPNLMTEYALFDQFSSESLGDQQSLAFRFTYQEADKTLSDDKVNKVHERFIGLLQQHLPITVR